MRLTFLGSGDAFGTGGRFNTCFHVSGGGDGFLIDCGASSLIAMRRFGVDPNGVATIFISHLHGDHFGGLPFFLLDAQFYSRRLKPLTIVGPPGLSARLQAAMEVFFPGSAAARRKFELIVREIAAGESATAADASVQAIEVRHECGAPAFGLRVCCGGKTIAYSGDTEWTEALVDIGRAADLFIVEALTFDKKVPQHLDYATLSANIARIGAKRVVLTHMGPDMLARANIAFECAHDGLVLDV